MAPLTISLLSRSAAGSRLRSGHRRSNPQACSHRLAGSRVCGEERNRYPRSTKVMASPSSATATRASVQVRRKPGKLRLCRIQFRLATSAHYLPLSIPSRRYGLPANLWTLPSRTRSNYGVGTKREEATVEEKDAKYMSRNSGYKIGGGATSRAGSDFGAITLFELGYRAAMQEVASGDEW